jgi:hypothetical protein
MEIRDAVLLIRDAVGGRSGIWADLGAGTGTFTQALMEVLGAGSIVYAIDEDAGATLANALHFVRDAEQVLSMLVEHVRPGGRVIVVEYDRRGASRWVPYPIPATRWPLLAESAGLTDPAITATRPSSYSGTLYTGVASRVVIDA